MVPFGLQAPPLPRDELRTTGLGLISRSPSLCSLRPRRSLCVNSESSAVAPHPPGLCVSLFFAFPLLFPHFIASSPFFFPLHPSHFKPTNANFHEPSLCRFNTRMPGALGK